MNNRSFFEEHDDLVVLFPIIFIIAVVPLIVILRQVPMVGILQLYWTSNPNVDFFSYYKMIWFLIANILLVIAFLFYLYSNPTYKIKSTILYFPMAIYTLFVVLSSLFAEHFYVAIIGFPDRYEGMLVLLGYILAMFLTMNLVNSQKQIKILLGSLGVSATVLGILGAFQFFGLDFFRSQLGRRLMLPSDLLEYADQLSFRFGEYTIYSTMYNTNYVGSYMVMLFTLSLVVYLLVTTTKHKVLAGAFSVLIFINLIGSRSRAGMMGFYVALFFLLILLRKYLRPNLIPIIIIVLCFFTTFIIMNETSGGSLSHGLSLSREISRTLEPEVGVFQDLIIDGQEMLIFTEDADLVVKIDEERSLLFFDEQGEELQYILCLETGEIELHHDVSDFFQFNYDSDNYILNFKYDRVRADFLIADDGFWIIGLGNQAYRTTDIEAWLFENRGSMGSGRGYIWSRSLPLLRYTWFLGTGADTYAIYFPQDDNVGKLKQFGRTRILVDKPHNQYLQVAINTGVPSLIAVIFIFAIYFLQSIITYWKIRYDSLYPIVGVGLFTSFIGYAVAALFNDSIISVAPVFWVLLGLGVSINLKLNKDIKQLDNTLHQENGISDTVEA